MCTINQLHYSSIYILPPLPCDLNVLSIKYKQTNKQRLGKWLSQYNASHTRAKTQGLTHAETRNRNTHL